MMKRAVQKVKEFSRLLFVLILISGAFIFAMFQGGSVSWAIFYTLLPFVIYSLLLFFYPIATLTASRRLSAKTLSSGSTADISIRIWRRFRFPLLYVAVTDIHNHGANEQRLFIMGIKKEVKWQYEMKHLSRGEYTFQGIEIEVSDFFGWIKKKTFIEYRETVLVYPSIKRRYPIPNDVQRGRGTSAQTARSKEQEAATAASIRDYQAGDRLAWIHWKSFAKTEQLMTKEFDSTEALQLFIFLDGRTSSLFEEQIELAVSFMWDALQKQTHFTFFIAGPDPVVIPSVQTEAGFRQVLLQLAKMKSNGDSIPFAPHWKSAAAIHPGKSVLISNCPDEALIQSVKRVLPKVSEIECVMFGEGSEGNAESVQYALSSEVSIYQLDRKEFLGNGVVG